MSLDGKIATRADDSRLSSRLDLRDVHQLRSQTDAVMIGIRTELIDDPRLTVRHVKGRNPIRIVVDSSARIPVGSRILGDNSAIVAVSRKASERRVNRLRKAGATVICCGKSQVDLKLLLHRLYQRGIRRLLLEGGGTLNWSMLKQGLVDELRITIAPLIVGGEEARTLVEGEGNLTIAVSFKLRLSRITRRRDEVVLCYRVKR
jgi:2,5-diamino-6-(ribosylamino)-4(3H)-pyrimidinone 5'-phosphate reductase